MDEAVVEKLVKAIARNACQNFEVVTSRPVGSARLLKGFVPLLHALRVKIVRLMPLDLWGLHVSPLTSCTFLTVAPGTFAAPVSWEVRRN